MGAQQSSCKDDEAKDEIPPSTNQCVGIDEDRDDLSSEGDVEAASPAGGYSSAGTFSELPRNGCTLATLRSTSTSESRRERMSHLEVEQDDWD